MAFNEGKGILKMTLNEAFSEHPKDECKTDTLRALPDIVLKPRAKSELLCGVKSHGSMSRMKSRDSFLDKIDYSALGLLGGHKKSFLNPDKGISEPIPFSKPRCKSIPSPTRHQSLRGTSYSDYEDDEDKGSNDDRCQMCRMTKITDSLYLGNDHDASDEDALRAAEITHVLSMVARKFSKRRRTVFDPVFRWTRNRDIKRKVVPMSDTGHTDVVKLLEEKDVLTFLMKSQKKRNKLLVHCQLGQNRSPTIMIAFLMKLEHITLHQAWRKVKQKRLIVQPHVKYIKQLRDWDMYIHGKHSTPNDFLHVKVSGEHIQVAHEHANTMRMTTVMKNKRQKMKKQFPNFSSEPSLEEIDIDISYLTLRTESHHNKQEIEDNNDRELLEVKTNAAFGSNNDFEVVEPGISSSEEESMAQTNILYLDSLGQSVAEYQDAIKADQRSPTDLNIDL
jgi:protein-tyrosine phosphatase